MSASRTPLGRKQALATVLSSAFAGGGLWSPSAVAAGATLPVTSCADDGSAGTLRNVMMAAPQDAVIDLTGLDCATITLTQGAIDISRTGLTATVVGPGAERLTIDGNEQDAIFEALELEIDSLTLTHGRVSGDYASGGCIGVAFDVVVRSSRIVECHAYGTQGAYGGGISAGYTATLYSTVVSQNIAAAENALARGGGVFANYGGVGVVDSTITGNTAIGVPALGGGVHSQGGSVIVRSTIDHNVADVGGGWYCEPGFLVPAFCDVENSTISDNVANSEGGGFVARNVTELSFRNSTTAFNTASSGHVGGVLIMQSPNVQIALDSAIFSNNVAPVEDLSPDIDTDAGNFPAVQGGNDLIMTPGRIQPFPLLVADPLLAPLADNGGPTRTRALMAGSPAIDVGDNAAGVPTDQRGRARVSGAAADIGAFEVQVDEIFSSDFE